MAYNKPGFFVKHIVNPVAMRFRIGGAHTLVVKRRSGGEQRVPVTPLEHDGGLYLVSVRGETDWVKNLRTAGMAEIVGGRHAGTFSAQEVPRDERAALVPPYLEANKSVKGLFERIPEPADHPAFRVERTSGD